MNKRSILVLLWLAFYCTTMLGQSGHLDSQDAIKRGNERYARGEYEAAINEYQQVQQGENAVYAQALYNIGVCYFELNLTDEAIAMYRRSIAVRDGRYPKALYALGVALEILNRLEDAKEAYREAIASSDDKYTEARLAVAHYRLGLLAGRGGDYEGAAILFREALVRSNDTFPAAHNNLGVMLALAGRTAEAEREFEIALGQSTEKFEEAAHNLKLCRSWLSKEMQTNFASLKIAEATLF